MVNDSIIGWVPSTKRTDHEGIDEYTISLPTVVLRQGDIFLSCFLSCSLVGSVSVLKWHGDVYGSNRLACCVDCDEVRSERPIKTRYRLVDSKGGGGRSIKRPHQSVLDGIVTLCCGP